MHCTPRPIVALTALSLLLWPDGGPLPLEGPRLYFAPTRSVGLPPPTRPVPYPAPAPRLPPKYTPGHSDWHESGLRRRVADQPVPDGQPGGVPSQEKGWRSAVQAQGVAHGSQEGNLRRGSCAGHLSGFFSAPGHVAVLRC